MLYDEWDKLLETRFVKKEDLILSGESITFRSYLVNLGELCQGHETTSVSNSQDRNEKVSETSRPFYNSNSQDDRKPVVWKRKGRIIRDFKKSEMIKFGSSPSCVDMKERSTGYQLKTPGDTFQQTLTVSDSSYKTENHSSYKTENAKLSRGDVEPRRSVCDILPILRQPSERKDTL